MNYKYYKMVRPAEKIIDCDDINKLCKLIETTGDIRYKATKIYNCLCDAVCSKDACKLLDGLKEEIIEKNYTSAKALANAVWLRFRHLGIGGSDAASITGVSKWKTILDLYYDKRDEKKTEKVSDDKQYIFDFGHAMEPFVAEEFERRFMSKYVDSFEIQFSMKYGRPITFTECRVFRDTYMYRNPEHKCMIADLDFIIELYTADGEIFRGIFECKTTSPFMIADTWKDEPPKYYQVQVNHYMSVMDYDFSVIACAADNSPANFFAHIIFRDNKFINDMINKEEKFWYDVLVGNPPYEEGINNLQTIANQVSKDNEDILQLNNTDIFTKLSEYDNLSSQIKNYKSIISKLEKQRDIILSDISISMGKADCPNAEAIYGNNKWTIAITEKVSKAIDYQKFFRELKKLHPEISSEIDVLKNNCLKNPTPTSSCSVKSIVLDDKKVA